MSKVLITPLVGTVRMINGTTYVGGDRYLITDRSAVNIRNLLSLDIITVLEGVEVSDDVTQKEFNELVEELSRSTPRKEGETAQEYNTNLARYAIEALNSKASTEEQPSIDASSRKTKGKEAASKEQETE
ncbi:MAG: hypothetical protein [Caudoviricetes sp.]|nr:MAG: hypothetical protein [Caudoviricetes sp.]